MIRSTNKTRGFMLTLCAILLLNTTNTYGDAREGCIACIASGFAILTYTTLLTNLIYTMGARSELNKIATNYDDPNISIRNDLSILTQTLSLHMQLDNDNHALIYTDQATTRRLLVETMQNSQDVIVAQCAAFADIAAHGSTDDMNELIGNLTNTNDTESFPGNMTSP